MVLSNLGGFTDISSFSNMNIISEKGDILLSAFSNDFKVYTGSNFEVNASNNTLIFSSCNTTLSNNSNLLMYCYSNVDLISDFGQLDIYAEAGYMNIFGWDTTTFSTSNDLWVESKQGMTLCNKNANFNMVSAVDATLVAQGGKFNILANSDDVYVYSASNVTVDASNHLELSAQSNITVSNIAGDFKLSSFSNMTIIAEKSDLTLAAYSNNMFINTSNNLTVSTSNRLFVFTKSNVTMCNLSSDFVVSSDSNVYVEAKKGNMTLVAHSNDLNLSASNLLNMSSSNKTLLVSQSNISFSNLTDDFNVSSYSNIKLIGGLGNVRVEASANTLDVASRSNMSIGTSNTLSIDASNIIGIATSNISLTSGQSTIVSASNNLLMTACNNASLVSQNTLTLSGSPINISSSGDISMTALSNVNFLISSAPDSPSDAVMTVAGNLLKVRGDMLITGTINTSNILQTTVIQETLKVNDKTILVASVGNGSNDEFNPQDSAANNGSAGLKVDGFPAGYNPAVRDAYTKALLWQFGDDTLSADGMASLGTSLENGATKESYWEVLGGGLRITHKKISGNTFKDLSFGFRVNDKDELELYKRFWDTTALPPAYKVKRVCRFGRVLPL
jgi:uncharacterized protein (DUF2345 family)